MQNHSRFGGAANGTSQPQQRGHLEILKNEINALRETISSMASIETRDDLIRKAKQQKALADKVEEHELLLEAERVSAAVKKHEEIRPPPTEDCPICLDPINIADEKVQHFPCCGNTLCRSCAAENYEHGHFTNCPLCRATPARRDDQKLKLVKERAADGRAWAQYNLGMWYMDGRMGCARKPKESLKWLELAAKQNFPDALCKLGELYYEGCMVAQSHSDAFSFFKKAADIGCDQSQSMVGKMYMNGQGVGVNGPMAVHYYTIAYGLSQSTVDMYHLALFFLNGSGGLNKSFVRARHYLEGAAKQGMTAAYFPLATTLMQLCQDEYDCIPNIPGHSCIPKVFYWTRKASKEHFGGDAVATSQRLDEMENHENAMCSNCYKLAKNHHPEKLKRCTRCKAEWYCGKECQRKHWRAGHKFDCIQHDG